MVRDNSKVMRESSGPIKTYVLVDLVDIRKELAAGGGLSRLESFWSSADAWANSRTNEPVEIEPGYSTSIDYYVATYSDSLILQCIPEPPIDIVFRALRSLLAGIKSNAGELYAIVSRGAEISAPESPALGGTADGSRGRPKYFQIGGSGAAFVNLYLADEAIKTWSEWKEKYHLYSVGKESHPSYIRPIEEKRIKGFNRTEVSVFALE